MAGFLWAVDMAYWEHIKGGGAMESFQGEIVKDSKGREVVRFTTASGVRGIVCTSIPMAALDKMCTS